MAVFKVIKRVQGKFVGKTEVVEKDVFWMGSSHRCDKILLDELIDSRHARIEFRNGAFFLDAEQSVTGVVHNFLPVREPVSLNEGDQVYVGSHLFSISLPDEETVLLIHENPPPFSISEEGGKKGNKGKWMWAMVCGVFLFPIMGYLVNQERFWQPGPLHALHKECTCQDCHTPFRGVETDKCGKCHENTVYHSVHPCPLVETPCSSCHPEHKGTHSTITSSSYKDEACLKCHPSFHKNPPDISVVETRVSMDMRKTFDHAAHFKKEKKMCMECHQFSPDKHEDFVKIKYESCLECHQEKQVVRHGDFQSCTACHSGEAKELDANRLSQRLLKCNEVQRERISKISLRGMHKDVNENCWKCHGARPIVSKPRHYDFFSHEKHLEENAGASQCLSCHEAWSKSKTDRTWDGPKSCESCHPLKEGMVVETKRVAHQAFRFSHEAHLEGMKKKEDRLPLYKKSCLACHQNEKGRFVPLPQPASCKKCHLNHENYGKEYEDTSRCLYCHPSIYKDANALKITQNSKLYPRFSHKLSLHKQIKCEECHLKMEETPLRKPMQLNYPLCMECHEKKENKDKDCASCHGYHSFFKKKKE